MLTYSIRATAIDTGRVHTITTQSKQSCLRYAALFLANKDWSDCTVEVGGKEYEAENLREALP